MTQPLVFALTFLVGALITVQAGVNYRLSLWAGGALPAAAISLALGLLLLAVVMVWRSEPMPHTSPASVPWWAWTGGAIGAFCLTTTVVVAPRLGATVLISIVVAGQATAAVVLDTYGLLGFETRPLSTLRFVGIAMVVGGVVFVRGT